MAKEDVLTFEGRVVEVLPDARYRVELENGHQIVAYTAGRMKKNRIKTLIGDRVMVEMTPYDLEKGRLVYRHKGDNTGPPPAARGQRPPPRRR
jgi:translation initiation factor IF-1